MNRYLKRLGLSKVNIFIGLFLCYWTVYSTVLALLGCRRKEHVPKDGGYINENLKPITNSPAKQNNER